jgi:hypothetical protein
VDGKHAAAGYKRLKEMLLEAGDSIWTEPARG